MDCQGGGESVPGRWVVKAALIAGVLVASAPTALANPPSNADPDLAPWFHSLHNATGMSCCDQADGHILADQDWHQTADGYEIRIDGEWRNVPPDVILKNSPNPTGSFVAFWAPNVPHPMIFCAVRPTDS